MTNDFPTDSRFFSPHSQLEAIACIATLLLQEITHLLCHHLTEVPSGTDGEVWGGEEAALRNVFLQQPQPP